MGWRLAGGRSPEALPGLPAFGEGAAAGVALGPVGRGEGERVLADVGAVPEQVFPAHGHRLVKQSFDCCREAEIQKLLKSLDADQIVLAGAETDVCVLQSALGLLELGFEVFLLEDCVFSNESRVAPALERMHQAGVVPCTYKTFFYEMTGSVDRDSLPESWRERMGDLREVFKSPYQLAPSE